MLRSEQDSNPDLCDTYKVDTMLYQLSYQANWRWVIMGGHDNPLNIFDALFKSIFNFVSIGRPSIMLCFIYISGIRLHYFNLTTRTDAIH